MYDKNILSYIFISVAANVCGFSKYEGLELCPYHIVSHIKGTWMGVCAGEFHTQKVIPHFQCMYNRAN